ncbi:Rrf2 family transcriptional regulator [Cupriavidus basilensis]|uniref:Rrf2 family transcriptional regulator n=1 Tax=Cupriavidus basilensis TaxID=68895 RepID=A0ABT6AGN8_9BURK|nr:Rrf2 family transcriptional regulator [Cupriavidus basilensis]MDF3831772.1 Rrf2 family transcriptional regulator [Cupriavidus basilensis]
MRLTTMTDYALRLLIYVARHPERLCTNSEIAQAYGISRAHLVKVTHKLSRQGWIATVRGRGGGIQLSSGPGSINLGDVVRSVEPDFDLLACLADGGACKLASDEPLCCVMDGARRSFLQHLESYTLADVLARTRSAPPHAAVLNPGKS